MIERDVSAYMDYAKADTNNNTTISTGTAALHTDHVYLTAVHTNIGREDNRKLEFMRYRRLLYAGPGMKDSEWKVLKERMSAFRQWQTQQKECNPTEGSAVADDPRSAEEIEQEKEVQALLLQRTRPQSARSAVDRHFSTIRREKELEESERLKKKEDRARAMEEKEKAKARARNDKAVEQALKGAPGTMTGTVRTLKDSTARFLPKDTKQGGEERAVPTNFFHALETHPELKETLTQVDDRRIPTKSPYDSNEKKLPRTLSTNLGPSDSAPPSRDTARDTSPSKKRTTTGRPVAINTSPLISTSTTNARWMSTTATLSSTTSPTKAPSSIYGTQRTSPVSAPSIHKTEAPVAPNSKYIKIEGPVKRSLRTTSLAAANALKQRFHLYPGQLDFGPLQFGARYLMSSTLTNGGPTIGRFRVRQSTDPNVKTSYKPGALPAGVSSRIDVEIEAISIGELETSVTIETEGVVLTLPITASIMNESDYREKMTEATLKSTMKRAPGPRRLFTPHESTAARALQSQGEGDIDYPAVSTA